ncbi:MAG: nucleotidyltransferase family protein [Nitrospirae bacterium]|nr:nucleotidyltransferase family protein [Nitrospirota bacterium]
MDFKLVLEKLLASFKEQGIRYALIGGFAFGLRGAGRSTVDIDFLVDRSDMDKVDTTMKGLGYECKYRSENVSQYVSPLKVFGEVDFLHAFREASLEMLERAEGKEVFNGALTVKTLIPEDLIGLKLQAIKNDPKREETDMADIKILFQIYKNSLDWSLIKKYFKIFGMRDLYEKMSKDING